MHLTKLLFIVLSGLWNSMCLISLSLGSNLLTLATVEVNDKHVCLFKTDLSRPSLSRIKDYMS